MQPGTPRRIDASGWQHLGYAVATQAYLPTIGGRVVAGFDDAVVVRAHQHQVPQRREPASPPGQDVVGVTVAGRDVATGEDASSVA